MKIRRTATAAVLLISGAVPLVTAPAVASAATTAASVRHSLCAPPADTIAPTISQVTFGRSSIDLNSGSRVQTVQATAADTSGSGTASGVAHLTVQLRGTDYFSDIKLRLTSGTAVSGDWTGRFVVSKYAHAGTVSIDFLSVSDSAGNEQDYPGFGRVPESPYALSLIPADNPTFTVTGTPATRPHRHPTGGLETFSLSASTVNTTATARRVRFHAQFVGTEPSRVFAQLITAENSSHHRFVYLRADLNLHSGRWSGALVVPQWLGRQTLDITLFVEYGPGFRPGSRIFDPQTLSARHLPSTLDVISGVDSTKPTLTALTVSPSSLDSTTGPVTLTITAKATDTGSGVKSISVNGGIRDGVNGVAAGVYPFAGIGYLSFDNFFVRLKKTSGGRWVGTTVIRECVPTGTYRLDADVSDAAGNNHGYGTKQLAKAAFPSTIEVTSKHGDIVAPYVFSAATLGINNQLILNFSEGVDHVNTSTLAVYRLKQTSSQFKTPNPITAISCTNGTHHINCSGSGGLVTSAILIVPSMVVGKTYGVFANLNPAIPQLADGNRNPMNWDNIATEVKDS
jgi:hypothetical protein